MSGAGEGSELTGPVADRVTIWPVEDGTYGLDATFQGASGYVRAEHHRRLLDGGPAPFSLRQELDEGWTLRFGPITAAQVRKALDDFLR